MTTHDVASTATRRLSPGTLVAVLPAMFAERFFVNLDIWRRYPESDPLRASGWIVGADGVRRRYALARVEPIRGAVLRSRPAKATVPTHLYRAA
jgi:hypothetical protein